MQWIEQNWPLFLLGIFVLLIALWWLVGSSNRVGSDTTPTLDKSDDSVSPVISAPSISPIEVPPPAQPAPLVPEPEALVEALHPIPAGPPDVLTRMKGVGPKVAALLNGLGITRYEQIAAWSDADTARVDAQLGAFKGRIARDQWVEQARLLAAGDTAGYEAKFGRLG